MGCLEEKKILQISSDLLKKMEMCNYTPERIFLMRFISLYTINRILIKKEWLSPETAALQVNSDSAGRFFPCSDNHHFIQCIGAAVLCVPNS